MADWMTWLKAAVDQEASDLFFVAGKGPCMKLDGHITLLSEEKLLPQDTERIVTELFQFAGCPMDGFRNNWDADFSFAVPGLARFRVNTYRQRGSAAAVIRIVSFDIPDWKELGIPEEVMKIAREESGLILVTGTAGSGKTTTQACIIDAVNETRDCHIVTLEDPIEYLHRHKMAIVSQREIANDTKDYLCALRACVRQAPDVILLGEMRDPETMHTAMSAAETGHMVIATLHTRGAVNAIERIIDTFPSSQQGQMRIQLASVLKTVISQQLIASRDGGMVPAFEIMQVNNAIRSMIRDNKDHQIDNAIAAGGKEGMVSMDQYLLKLYQQGTISAETVLHFADKPDMLRRSLKSQ